MQEIAKNNTKFELITVIITGLIVLSFLAIITTNLSINYTEIDYSNFTVSGQEQYISKSDEIYTVNYEMVIESETNSSLLIWSDTTKSLMIDLMRTQFYVGYNNDIRRTIDFDRNINSNGLKILFSDFFIGIDLTIIAYESLGFSFEDFWLNATDVVDPPNDEEINNQFLELYDEQIEVFKFDFKFHFDQEKSLTIVDQRNQGLLFAFIMGAFHFIIVLFNLIIVLEYKRREKLSHDQGIQMNKDRNSSVVVLSIIILAFLLLIGPNNYGVRLLFLLFLTLGLAFGTIFIMSFLIRDVNSLLHLIPLSLSHLVWVYYFGLVNDISFSTEKIPEITTSFFGYLPRFIIASLSFTLTLVSAFLYFKKYLQKAEIRNKNLAFAIVTYIWHLSFIVYIY